MHRETFSTSQVAKAVGLHGNTIRLYEKWGYITPAARTPNGYRHFSQVHIGQVRLIMEAHQFTWLSGKIRDTGLAIIRHSAKQDWQQALRKADELLALLHEERSHAEAAAAYLEEWAQGAVPPPDIRPLHIGEAAELLGVSIDSLRNWERNGLIQVPRNPHNRYRRYGPDEIGRLRIIRLLTRSRYSLMSILRVLSSLDEGPIDNLRDVLNTSRRDEMVFYFTDNWLTSLESMEKHAHNAVAILKEQAALAGAPQGAGD